MNLKKILINRARKPFAELFDMDWGSTQWDVDKKAESLNKALFGKKLKTHIGTVKADINDGNDLANYGKDSDDDDSGKLSKKAKKKLKERKRKENKRNNIKTLSNQDDSTLKNGVDEQNERKNINSSDSKKGKGKLKAVPKGEKNATLSEHEDTSGKDGKSKKKRKRKNSLNKDEKDANLKSESEPKKKRKKKNVQDSEKNEQNVDVKVKQSTMDDNDLNCDAEQKKKRKRHKKKKPNSKKNKYKHLGLKSQTEKMKSFDSDDDANIKNKSDFVCKKESKKDSIISEKKLTKNSKKRKNSDSDESMPIKKLKIIQQVENVPKEMKPDNKLEVGEIDMKQDETCVKKSKKTGKLPKAFENHNDASSKDKKNVKSKDSSILTNGPQTVKKSKTQKRGKNIVNESELHVDDTDEQQNDDSSVTKLKKKKNKATKACEIQVDIISKNIGNKKTKRDSGSDTANETGSLDINKKSKIQKKEKDVTEQGGNNSKKPENKGQSPFLSSSPFSQMQQKMVDKLASARFRFINEQLYTMKGGEAFRMFQQDKTLMNAYSTGFQGQAKNWSVNPLDVIIKQLNTKPSKLIVADFGCGEATLSASVPQKVHSFDLYALNERVTVCDMSKTPLSSASVDVVVFCLSLMGTNLCDYLVEANRVLKEGGLLKISEVVSRFTDPNDFVKAVSSLGFKAVNTRELSTMFYLMDFKKIKSIEKSSKQAKSISLKPCMYKKR